MGDRGSTGESHVARLFKLAPPMCSVHSRTGHGHALRLVRLAARQLTAVAQPLQGPLASARSCVPLRMRSITTGVSHLYRADPSSGHQAPMLLRDARGCDDGSATRCTCSRALSSLADSDPKARSALRIQEAGKSGCRCTRTLAGDLVAARLGLRRACIMMWWPLLMRACRREAPPLGRDPRAC